MYKEVEDVLQCSSYSQHPSPLSILTLTKLLSHEHDLPYNMTAIQEVQLVTFVTLFFSANYCRYINTESLAYLVSENQTLSWCSTGNAGD